jgi:hypothetical protein
MHYLGTSKNSWLKLLSCYYGGDFRLFDLSVNVATIWVVWLATTALEVVFPCIESAFRSTDNMRTPVRTREYTFGDIVVLAVSDNITLACDDNSTNFGVRQFLGLLLYHLGD